MNTTVNLNAEKRLSTTKASIKKENVITKVDSEFEVVQKDRSGKKIDFFQWYPSSLLPKPARSPVCIIIVLFTLNYLFKYHFILGNVYYTNRKRLCFVTPDGPIGSSSILIKS
jgi:hypothetical protein